MNARATKGRFFHSSNRDRLDHSREWFEEALRGCYLSYAVVPSEYGLIHDRRDYNVELKGKEKLQEAIKQLKERNPDLDSIYIRLGVEEQ